MKNCCFFAFGIIFFIIGIICYFLGCNPDYSEQCYNYNIINGISEGYIVKKKLVLVVLLSTIKENAHHITIMIVGTHT